MSPRAAIDSDVFRFYLFVAVALLIIAAVVIAGLKWRSRVDVSHAGRALLGWIFLVPLGFLCIFLGREVTIAFFTFVAGLGFKEFARATGLYRDWAMSGAVYLGILATGVISLISDPTSGLPGWFGMFMALPVFVIAIILVIPIVRNRSRGQLQALALAILGFVYFGWMFGHLGFLANSPYAYSYLFYLLFAVELNDVAAYTFGKLFGRHQLRSNISPNKTWEGALGAVGISLTLPWILRFTFPHFQPRDCILAGLIVGIGGQMGDLAISVIKRDLGIKDMGAAIPGHGGILDRVDSLIYVAPLFLHVVRYYHDLY